ncbi:hypothetical protein HRI_003723800 [Hibiscus trionum]|uniref:Tyrosinase copper-binding domain-containing protein n=1 Tax=Hibiscus trionum TaxID=183268 RepID=A0A9W7IQQ8_HIBTR|nr:hypothetical protein HRI_003723800 [Hibiscus trionum]
MDFGGSKWISTITLAFLSVILITVTLWNLESNQAQHSFVGDLTNKLEGWFLGENGFIEDGNKRGFKAVGPNMTSCHPSYGRTDLLVNCCPPGFQTPVPFVDFQFPDPQSPLRIRRPAHAVDADYIARYNKALSIMKSLPHDDPRSFSRQGNLHCLFCSGAYDQQSYNAPLSIHETWLFFPWHRMMIYFHERIIGSLIGDETFALPYWAWDIPEGMVIPDMYTNKSSSFFHTERDVSHYPPKTADLNYVSDTNLSREDQLDINLSFMYNQMVSGARKTELFMGCKYKAGAEGYCDGPGTIELAPHNALHTWVGSSLNPGREDMGEFYSAARDPIFYAHHSNIDRLWEVWREANKHELDITDPDWLESFFFFYDENLRLVRVKVADVLDTIKLGYSYEQVHRPWLNKRPEPSFPPKLARQMLKTKENENKLQMSSTHVSSSDFDPLGRALDASLTVKVRNHWSKKKKEKVIVVHGIEVKGDAYVKFDVYVNLIDQSKISPKFREFAGTFAHIPGAAASKTTKRKIDLKLGVSELLEDLEADRDENIWVTLLPRTPSCSNVTIGGVRMDYIE